MGSPLSNLAALGRWADDHAKDLRVTAQRRDADGPLIDRALAIVLDFITKRRLILFGGLAIDYALRLKGSRIYPDDERPDFDVLSPRSVDDAYDLADLLQAAGFPEVGAVRGIHVQTMKVRVDFVWVADIGYAPDDVFATIPTVEYRGLRVVHPDFQRMDMHLAFCFPFNAPPREDVFHRWRKDLKRFNLLEEFYPLRGELPDRGPLAEGQAALGVPIAGDARELAVALHGFAAYSVLRESLDALAAALGVGANVGAPRLALSFPDARSFRVELPVGAAVHVASPDPASVVAGGPDAHWRDPYMDVFPESVRAGSLVVLSTRKRQLAASVARVAVGPAAEPMQARVVTPQYLLLLFLYEAHRAEGAAREVWRAYYRHTLEILHAAEAACAEAMARDPSARQALMDAYAASPFAPTVCTLGDVNHDAAYTIKMATTAAKLGDRPPAVLQLDPDVADLLPGLPQNYYPGSAKQRPEFDCGRSPLFRRSGAPRRE